MTAYDYQVLAYNIILGALSLMILFKGTGPMRRTITTMLAIYGCQLFLLPPLWPSWQWSLLVAMLDVAGCVIVTWHPAGRWQSLIGLTFLLQFAAHMGKVIVELSNKTPDFSAYGWGLSMLAFMQLILVGGWWSDNHRRNRASLRRIDRPEAAPVYRKGMER